MEGTGPQQILTKNLRDFLAGIDTILLDCDGSLPFKSLHVFACFVNSIYFFSSIRACINNSAQGDYLKWNISLSVVDTTS
jgi:hypothetical protein